MSKQEMVTIGLNGECKKLKPLKMCVNCAVVTENYHKQCPHCGQESTRTCHTKHCLNFVNGDVGTTCDDCKSRDKSDN